ncbi:MAG TPA: endonuclease/exonuclease/phosphatase family protein [Candidatus Hydrogenedens sp.]|mgnify:FL=1|nr:endonuclease/exonuclease/phosphatase family protein [Candidatus Hydrogenedens sp.]HOL18833.1 endonuclease/exonuclease/phosphatase family protein [Candidatus Hydrogenedens sp.]HPP59301.1 endonuclease/exonuclease/phosphatase family protein [Candidatus Hydrogenedens sp.]
MGRKKSLFFWSIFILSPVLFPIITFLLLAVYSANHNPNPHDFRNSIYKNVERKPLSEPITLKIVTYNIQDTWVVGRNRQERMYALARKLIELDPDIVGFQESFIQKDRDILIKELTTKSRLKYYQYFPSGLVGSGKFTMSAFPIREIFFYRYKVTGDWYRFWEGDWWAGKGCGLSRIEIPEIGFLDFFNTHAQAGYGNPKYKYVKEAQMKELANYINTACWTEYPVILVGDFNTRRGDVAHDSLVMIANLTRVMNIESSIDHIYARNSPYYQFEVLDTIEIQKGLDNSGKPIQLSDHNGFMSTIRITPKQH